jgi:tetratricopeptide (TPR) repeat protein
MAINKRKASPMLKVGIIAISVLMVLAFTLPLLSPDLFSGGTTNPDGTTGTGELEAIAAQYGGSIQTFEAQLASDPTSYTVLVNMGNTYFDWAIETANATGGQTPADRPIWIASASYYDRALAIDSSDPNVGTDASIARYYSGDVAGAIELVEQVIEANPDFAIAHYNAGIFYRAAARDGDAVVAFNTYLELDPDDAQGNNARAQQYLSEIQSAETTTAP